eukprot:1138913-Pelagomonas_calceolata.AAC.7
MSNSGRWRHMKPRAAGPMPSGDADAEPADAAAAGGAAGSVGCIAATPVGGPPCLGWGSPRKPLGCPPALVLALALAAAVAAVGWSEAGGWC